MDYIQIISSIPDENEEATRDSLMANALSLDLIPEGNVPRNGNCMFHAVAHGLSVNGNSVNQEEVRNAAAKWVEDNQLINGDVHLPDLPVYSSLCHGVEDQQDVYSRGVADDHRSEDNRGAADDHRSEDNRGAADDDQQSGDVRNEECGSRQFAYCTRPSNICDLPDEVLHLIFEHVASGGGTNIGLMKDTWTD